MNKRIKSLKKYIVDDRLHRAFHRDAKSAHLDELAEDFRAAGMSAQERSGRMFEAFLAAETPVILPDEKIELFKNLQNCKNRMQKRCVSYKIRKICKNLEEKNENY